MSIYLMSGEKKQFPFVNIDNTINAACGRNFKTFCRPTSIKLNVLVKATRALSHNTTLI